MPAPSFVDAWRRCQDRIDALFATTTDLGERAAGIAEALRKCCPQASHAACYLESGGAIGYAARPADKAGDGDPEALRKKLSERGPRARRKLATAKLSAAGLRGHRLCWVAVEADGARLGAVGLVLPPDAGELPEATALLLLGVAEAVGWRSLADRARQSGAAPGDSDPEERAAGDVAESVGPVMHDLGNTLNHLMLEISALERFAPPDLQERLQQARRVGRTFATMMTQYAGYRYGKQTRPYPVDVNEAAAAAAAQVSRPGVAVELSPGAGAGAALATRPSLLRLLRLLMEHAPAPAGQAALRVRTGRSADGARVQVLVDSDVALTEAEAAGLFEAFPSEAGQPPRFELATCRGILRRLKGSLRAECSSRGTTLIVELPAA